MHRGIPNIDRGLSFLEITKTGIFNVTTITNAGDAIHSRNGIVLKEIIPSQN
jgi:hypothetical protein